MSAKIGVLVKKESFWTKATGSLTILGLFRKSKIKFTLDGTTHLLEAQDDVYYFDVEAGEHEISFVDPKAKSKRRTKKVGSALLGSVAGYALSGSGSVALGSALSGASSVKNKKDGDVQLITLVEKEEMVISCKATGKGTVKLERIK